MLKGVLSMGKRGPLGKAEIFYIEEHYKSGKPIEDIAQDLDRSNNSIQSHIESSNISKKTIIEEQFVYKRGSTIMTENASTMIDSKRQKTVDINKSCVTRIKK